jgi:hypothetical protein
MLEWLQLLLLLKEVGMQLPQMIFDWSATPSSFVASWSRLYRYPKEYLYEQNIHKLTFSITDVAQLYEWKNGSRLSQKKQAAFDTKIGARLQRINQLKPKLDVDQFREEFADVSTIWKLFYSILLHQIPTPFLISMFLGPTHTSQLGLYKKYLFPMWKRRPFTFKAITHFSIASRCHRSNQESK